MAVAVVEAFSSEEGSGGVAVGGPITAESLVEDVNSAIPISPWLIAVNSAIPGLFSLSGLLFGVTVPTGGDCINDIEGCFFEKEREGGEVPTSS